MFRRLRTLKTRIDDIYTSLTLLLNRTATMQVDLSEVYGSVTNIKASVATLRTTISTELAKSESRLEQKWFRDMEYISAHRTDEYKNLTAMLYELNKKITSLQSRKCSLPPSSDQSPDASCDQDSEDLLTSQLVGLVKTALARQQDRLVKGSASSATPPPGLMNRDQETLSQSAEGYDAP